MAVLRERGWVVVLPLVRALRPFWCPCGREVLPWDWRDARDELCEGCAVRVVVVDRGVSGG